MKREYVLVSLFFLISAIFFYLFYNIVIPFFTPIAWAGVFVILSYPLYEQLLPRVKRRGIASLIMCLMILLLIIGPVGYLMVALIKEASDAVAYVNEMYKSGELNALLSFDLPWIESMKAKLGEYYDLSKINLDQIARDAANQLSGVVVSQTSSLITNGGRIIFYFVLMFFTMYYFFKDGERLIIRVRRLMPLTPAQVTVTFAQLRDIIQATMYGGMVIAVLQGIMGGLLFWAVGIPSAVFWGAVMAFLSIIPIVGAFIIYIPAGFILALAGSWMKGLIVVFVGTLIISQVDNVVRPLLIAGKASMHLDFRNNQSKMLLSLKIY